MRATRPWALAGALFALSCSCSNRAWNYDETERIGEAMRPSPLSDSEARGLHMGAALPLAKGPGYSLSDIPASKPARRRRAAPGKPGR